MTHQDPEPLRSGDSLRCPHCRRWPVVTLGYQEGTDYTLGMLCFECGGRRFYAGQQDSLTGT
jgi:DNA-directed RNA polymerase subunit RPC12/RpoP